MNDTRLKAAVGYVPYFGQPLLPAFGREQEGLENVDLPYLAIAGSEDIDGPRATMTALGMTRLTDVRQLVLLSGVRHGFDVPSSDRTSSRGRSRSWARMSTTTRLRAPPARE